jgi:hypothetical protein
MSELASSCHERSSAAHAADERQRGGSVSEFASSPVGRAAPRTGSTSAGEADL